MKAMESWHSGCAGFDILHTDVVEVKEERRAYTVNTWEGPVKYPGNRVYLCRCCGKKWVESITSPLTFSDELDLHDYYDEWTECKPKNQ